MKRTGKLSIALAILGALSSCSAIPTLPPLDSTVIVEAPDFMKKTATLVSETTATLSPVAPTGEMEETKAAPQETEAQTETPIPDPTTQIPTRTPAPTRTLVPTRTFTATLEPTDQPKATSLPTKTPTRTPEPTPTAVVYLYQLQMGSPSFTENFAHPEDGCSWLGVAGQVFNDQGSVVKQLVVQAKGTIKGKSLIDELAVTGAHTEYGPGGYELELSTTAEDTSGEVILQLFNLDGKALSEPLELRTYASCEHNLALVNFQEK